MLKETLEQGRVLTDAALELLLPPATQHPVKIHQAMRHSVFAGGKRLRPIVCMVAGRMVAEQLPAGIEDVGAALEMLHTYSLIHDDLPALDNDDLRRGRPTSHKVFGEAIAILAGDALLTRAFHLLSEVPSSWDAVRVSRRLQALAILGEAAGTRGLIGGQVEDLESEGREVSAEALERLHRAKTGALLT